MSREQIAARVQAWLVRWLAATVPGLQTIKVDRKTGRVSVRDSLGWRDVGTTADYVSVARALGVFEVPA